MINLEKEFLQSIPIVSVLMTAFNREEYIAEAIESILSSSYEDFELIIVDDRSTDNTLRIAQNYAEKDARIYVYSNEKNLGDYLNRNKAASYAKGKYIKYVDSDDLLYTFSLQVMVESMERFPEAAIGLCSKKSQDAIPFPYMERPQEVYYKHFFEDSCLDIGPLGFIVNAQLFKEYGAFSGKRFIGDTEFLLGFCQLHNAVKIPSSLVFWRIHEGQEIVQERNTIVREEETLRILEENFNRTSCPLTAIQKYVILKKNRKLISRSIVKKFLKGSLSYNTFISLWKNNSLQITDLF